MSRDLKDALLGLSTILLCAVIIGGCGYAITRTDPATKTGAVVTGKVMTQGGTGHLLAGETLGVDVTAQEFDRCEIGDRIDVENKRCFK